MVVHILYTNYVQGDLPKMYSPVKCHISYAHSNVYGKISALIDTSQF